MLINEPRPRDPTRIRLASRHGEVEANADRPRAKPDTTLSMIIALPLTENGEFSPHYGQSSRMALFEVDREGRRILRETRVTPPEPEPCGWADWLAEQGVDLLLAGGLGRGAQHRLAAAGIPVLAGVAAGSPRELALAWLEDRLTPGPNACDGHEHHGDEPHEHGHHHRPGGCHGGH